MNTFQEHHTQIFSDPSFSYTLNYSKHGFKTWHTHQLAMEASREFQGSMLIFSLFSHTSFLLYKLNMNSCFILSSSYHFILECCMWFESFQNFHSFRLNFQLLYILMDLYIYINKI